MNKVFKKAAAAFICAGFAALVYATEYSCSGCTTVSGGGFHCTKCTPIK